MLILSADDVRRAVPMSDAMDAVASAFAQLSNQQADVPLRPHVNVPPVEGVFLVMPAYLSGSGALGVKLLTLFLQNPERYQTPSINALVMLFDAKNGLPLALMDGGWLARTRERWRSLARARRRSLRRGRSARRGPSSASGW